MENHQNPFQNPKRKKKQKKREIIKFQHLETFKIPKKKFAAFSRLPFSASLPSTQRIRCHGIIQGRRSRCPTPALEALEALRFFAAGVRAARDLAVMLPGSVHYTFQFFRHFQSCKFDKNLPHFFLKNIRPNMRKWPSRLEAVFLFC